METQTTEQRIKRLWQIYDEFDKESYANRENDLLAKKYERKRYFANRIRENMSRTFGNSMPVSDLENRFQTICPNTHNTYTEDSFWGFLRRGFFRAKDEFSDCLADYLSHSSSEYRFEVFNQFKRGIKHDEFEDLIFEAICYVTNNRCDLYHPTNPLSIGTLIAGFKKFRQEPYFDRLLSDKPKYEAKTLTAEQWEKYKEEHLSD